MLLQTLSRDYKSLEAAFNKNSDAFSRSFCYVDALLWVLRRAFNDMLNERPLVMITDGGKQIDLPGYLKLYEEHLIAQNNEPASRIELPEEDQPVVFGGP